MDGAASRTFKLLGCRRAWVVDSEEFEGDSEEFANDACGDETTKSVEETFHAEKDQMK